MRWLKHLCDFLFRSRPRFVRAKVWWVYDGDTLSAEIEGKMTCIRLDAIDCPEGNQEWGDVAKAGLIKLTYNQVVELELHGKDIYGRTLATVYKHTDHGRININEQMVMKGHAWVYRRYYSHLSESRRQALLRLERWARGHGVGLWRAENPVAPWEWRREERSAG